MPLVKGFGSSEWGSSPWGSAVVPVLIPPTITPVDPSPNQAGISQTLPLCIVLSDDVQVNQATIRVAVNGVNWVLGGVSVNGATLVTAVNGQNGFNLLITPPTPYPFGSRQEVSVSVTDTELQSTDLVYSFTVGIGPRLLSVRNPMPNLLLAHFNRPMKIDEAFSFVPNWEVTTVSEGAKPLTVTEVLATSTQPNVAHIRYVGGGSTYKLTVMGNILTQAGNPLDAGFNSAVFEIMFGDEAEPDIRLFDSVFGPLGISQGLITRRTMDKHTADRSLALALDEQFRLRFQQLDATVGRDGKNGKLRTT